MTVTIDPLPPEAAIAALRVRRAALVETFDWRDLWEREHAGAGTVAKSAGFDILGDVFAGLDRALTEGRTPRQFAGELEPLLRDKGWWGRKLATDPLTGETEVVQLGSARRLATIFDANVRVSYATGHWTAFERGKRERPWLRYVAILDGRTRPAHAARHNLCLRVDDPYWDTWAPPCGWGCRCTLQALSDRDVERMRDELVFSPPPDEMRDWINARTGDVVTLPAGIDPGWGHNPGKAGFERFRALGEKLVDAPAPLSAEIGSDRTLMRTIVDEPWRDWLDAHLTRAVDEMRGSPTVTVVGVVDPAVQASLAARGRDLSSAAITVAQGQIRHLAGAHKGSAAVDAETLRRLPEILAAPSAVLIDKGGAIVFVRPDPDAPDMFVRIVVKAGRDRSFRGRGGDRRSVTVNEVVSAGVVHRSALADANAYTLVSGDL